MTMHSSPARIRWAIAGVLTAAIALAGCGTDADPSGSGSASSGAGPDGCISDFDATKDYFPQKQEIVDAENFSLTYHKSYQVLTVKEPTAGGDPESYVLVRCGAPTPELTGDLAGAPVVTTPVKSLYSASTTHIPSLEALDQLETMTGVASKALISSEAALKRVAADDVVEFAPAGTVDAEQIVAGSPDVLITAGYDDPAFATIRDAEIPVLADAEFLETTPLGRAEWIKYFAALTGEEERAATTYDKISKDYADAVALAKDAEPVETVISQPYQGAWSVPAGGSHLGRMLKDARADWPYADKDSTGSINTDLETVFDESREAKIWLTSSNWTTKKQALAEESRFSDFAAFKSGQVWAPSLQVNEAGGNNYFELGVLRPDLAVQDMIAILHPDLLPDHEFTFYQQLK